MLKRDSTLNLSAMMASQQVSLVWLDLCLRVMVVLTKCFFKSELPDIIYRRWNMNRETVGIVSALY